MPYNAGWNMPGYLPDHVDQFDSLEEAVAFLVNEINFRWDGDYVAEFDSIDHDVIDARYQDTFDALMGIEIGAYEAFESWEHPCDGNVFWISLTSH